VNYTQKGTRMLYRYLRTIRTRYGTSQRQPGSRGLRFTLIAALAALNIALWPQAWTNIAGDGAAFAQSGARYNGFDVSNATIPKSDIRSGGPPRDGIPSLDDPSFIPASEADFMRPGDEVIGFVEGGEAHAYPLRILVWHEIANDTVGGKPIAVTYCPLCGTSMVFSREIEDEATTFGVSGLLYNSDVLMYDRATESLWSQLKMEAVAGPRVGYDLEWLPSEHMTWSAWKEEYPDSKVLSRETGYRRDYGRNPYAGYERTERVMFPVPQNRTELDKKEWVYGVIVNGEAKAYPRSALAGLEGGKTTDSVGGETIQITYDTASKRAVFETKDGERIPHVGAYWFAWQAFYPQTELYGDAA